MVKLIHGERIGKEGKLAVGCSAVIFDRTHSKVLLTRRADNGRWCIPGGHMEAGESAAKACAREIFEEVGLRVRVGKLIGVYSSPDWLLEYADGNRYQLVGLCFEAAPMEGEGEPALSDEVTEVGYFSREEMARMDVMERHVERIEDAFAGREASFVK